ncbi:MAG: arsenate reductase [Pseudomonadales bacterium]|nr:arsenate reductase [Gammaproteobacteria bacterium]NNC54845.1 arsenate reductase [Pseudomonadales bacterium]NNL57674.1 arsenate reductase [Pseudomonadales bacterium]
MIILYGIKNCDSVRKAKKFLASQGYDYRYHDFREHGIDAERLGKWLHLVGPHNLINKRSTSWKKLSGRQRESLAAPGLEQHGTAQQRAAIKLLLSEPTLVKRPVIEFANGEVVAGFTNATMQRLQQDNATITAGHDSNSPDLSSR